MNFIKTPTPNYQRNSQNPRPQQTGFLAWLASLLQTPTPVYRTVAVQSNHAEDADR